jgi:hypothetical protein
MDNKMTEEQKQNILDLFNYSQNGGIVHPLTCGNSTCRKVLQIDIDKEILYCPICSYTQPYPMSLFNKD